MINLQNVTYYQKYKDKLLQKSRNYYEKNKEQRKEYRKNKYNNMTNEERLKVLENLREWYHKLDLVNRRLFKNYMSSC